MTHKELFEAIDLIAYQLGQHATALQNAQAGFDSCQFKLEQLAAKLSAAVENEQAKESAL